MGYSRTRVIKKIEDTKEDKSTRSKHIHTCKRNYTCIDVWARVRDEKLHSRVIRYFPRRSEGKVIRGNYIIFLVRIQKACARIKKVNCKQNGVESHQLVINAKQEIQPCSVHCAFALGNISPCDILPHAWNPREQSLSLSLIIPLLALTTIYIIHVFTSLLYG